MFIISILCTDSGYPGSPASGLASYQSQVWGGAAGEGSTDQLQLARRELAGLLRDQVILSPDWSTPSQYSPLIGAHHHNTDL